jgi:phosphate transport system substrate-binding protein
VRRADPIRHKANNRNNGWRRLLLISTMCSNKLWIETNSSNSTLIVLGLDMYAKRILKLLFVALLSHNLAPDSSAKASQRKIVLTGSSSVAPLVNELGKRFEKKNPGVRVDVQTGGSSRGINDVRAGIADIGMVSRALKSEEADLKSHTIAIDGIGLIVHKTNSIPALSNEQVVDIYLGKITNWKTVGSHDRKITVVNKAEGRSTLELFLSHFKLLNKDLKVQVVIGENQQGIKAVAGNPGAVGYVSIGAAEFEERNGTNIRLLPLSNIAATVENLRTGKFPLSRPLNLVTKGKISDLGNRFIQFSQSKEVQDLVDAQFLVAPQR